MAKSGTPRKVTLDGETFNVATDANFSQNPGQAKEGIRHTGGTMMKTTLEVETVESVTLIVDGTQFSSLKEKSKRDVNFPMSYEEASGDIYRAVGAINLDARETEENRIDVMLIPDGEWEPFLA